MRTAAPTYYIVAVAALLSCLSGLCTADGTDQAGDIGDRGIRVDALGISLYLPAGWHLQMLDGRAARLVPSREAQSQLAALSGVVDREVELWPIEMVVWTSPAPQRTPEQAVAGHEQLLADSYSYQRETIEPFTSTFSLPGVAVSGKIRAEEEDLLVLFAGYTLSEQNIVVGTFCHPADREVIARLFRSLIRTVGPIGASPTGAQSPPPIPVESPRTDRPETSASIEHPQTVTEPPPSASPSASIGPDRTGPPPQPLLTAQTGRAPSIPTPLQPIQPSVAAQQPVSPALSVPDPVSSPVQQQPLQIPAPPADAQPRPAIPPLPYQTPFDQWVRHTVAEGLALQMPPAWSAATNRGVFHAHNADRTEGIMVCPLFSMPPADDFAPGGQNDVDMIRQYWQELYGYVFSPSSHLSIQRSGQNFDVFSGTLALEESNAHAIVTIAADQPIILLTAVYAPPEQFEQLLPKFRQILAGISLPRLAPKMPRQLSGQTISWASPDGRLLGKAPGGWQIRADIGQYNGHTVITLHGRSEEQSSLRFAWRQPYTPFFRELTPWLRGLGRLSGQQYRDSPQDAPLTILSRLSSLELITQELLDDIGVGPQDIEMQQTRPSEQVKSLADGREQTGAIIRIKGRCLTGPVTANYLLATAQLPIAEGSFRWHAGYVMWSGADSFTWAARRALGTVLGTAKVAGPASAEDDLSEMVAAARSAFGAVAAEYTCGLLPLLSGSFQAQAAGPIRIPGSLLGYWTADSLE